MIRDPFLDTLHADGPVADRAQQMMLYGQFEGSRDGTLKYLDPEGARRETTAEVHFGSVTTSFRNTEPTTARACSGCSRK